MKGIVKMCKNPASGSVCPLSAYKQEFKFESNLISSISRSLVPSETVSNGLQVMSLHSNDKILNTEEYVFESLSDVDMDILYLISAFELLNHTFEMFENQNIC